MTISYFTLSDGVLELHFDKLVIYDKAKRNRFSILAIAISGLVYSITCTFRGYKDKDSWWFYFGIVVALFWTAFLIIKKKEFQKIDNEIYLNDISQVSFKGGKDNTTTATIITHKKKFRKVNIETNNNLIVQFKNKLKELNIKVTKD